MGKDDGGPKGVQFSKPPYFLTAKEVEQELETNVEKGLSKVVAAQALEKYGKNQLEGGDGVPVWEVLFKQVGHGL